MTFKVIFIGTIVSKTGCRQYRVEFTDGTSAKQSCVHIFGAFSKRYKFNPGDYCICVSDERNHILLPGVVTGRTRTGIDIEFIDGSV